MPKQTWAESWGSKPVDYNRTTDELAKELKKVRNLTSRRVASLNRKKSFSFASYQYDQSMGKQYIHGKQPDIKTMSYQAIEKELRIHHQFWSSETATEKGSKSQQIAQSKRIFGVDQKGRPRRLMSFDEGKAFWAAYYEFQNLYRADKTYLDSNRIQRILGETMFGTESEDFDLLRALQITRDIAVEDYNRVSPFNTDALRDKISDVRDILLTIEEEE